MSEPDPPFFLDPKFTPADIQAYQRRKANEEPVGRPNGNGAAGTQLDRRLALGLDMDKNGNATANLSNCAIIIERDKGLQRIVWYDEFLQRIMTDERAPREWTDADDIETAIYIQTDLGIRRMGKDTVCNAVIAHAYRHTRNCVREWLDILEWDGVERIKHFFPEHFGADSTEYTRAVSRNFWLCLAARIYRPGCQVDNMVVLEGGQGIGKSKALRTIGGAFFADLGAMALDKSFFECLQGKFLLEIGEMDAFSRSEVERVKTAVSRPTDRFRESYGRFAKDHPRQCVFVGTTNRDDWNRDDTGARRFWPIQCHGNISAHAIDDQREQLFAETVQAFKDGAQWWHTPTKETKDEQESRYADDVWLGPVARFITHEWSPPDSMYIVRKDPLEQLRIGDILGTALDIPLGRQSRSDQMRVATCLRRLGWKSSNKRDGISVVKVWTKPEVET